MEFIYAIGLIIIILVVVRIFQDTTRNKSVDKFLSSNKDYAMIEINQWLSEKGVYVAITRIDGKKVAFKSLKGKAVYYVTPWSHVLDMIATKSTPNPFKKDEPTSRDEVSVSVEANQTYVLSYDFENKKYQLKEL